MSIKAGRDDAALRVDFVLGVGVAQGSDGGDAIAGDGHIGGIPGVAGAVDDVAIADQQIVTCLGGRGYQAARRRPRRQFLPELGRRRLARSRNRAEEET